MGGLLSRNLGYWDGKVTKDQLMKDFQTTLSRAVSNEQVKAFDRTFQTYLPKGLRGWTEASIAEYLCKETDYTSECAPTVFRVARFMAAYPFTPAGEEISRDGLYRASILLFKGRKVLNFDGSSSAEYSPHIARQRWIQMLFRSMADLPPGKKLGDATSTMSTVADDTNEHFIDILYTIGTIHGALRADCWEDETPKIDQMRPLASQLVEIASNLDLLEITRKDLEAFLNLRIFWSGYEREESIALLHRLLAAFQPNERGCYTWQAFESVISCAMPYVESTFTFAFRSFFDLSYEAEDGLLSQAYHVMSPLYNVAEPLLPLFLRLNAEADDAASSEADEDTISEQSDDSATRQPLLHGLAVTQIALFHKPFFAGLQVPKKRLEYGGEIHPAYYEGTDYNVLSRVVSRWKCSSLLILKGRLAEVPPNLVNMGYDGEVILGFITKGPWNGEFLPSKRNYNCLFQLAPIHNVFPATKRAEPVIQHNKDGIFAGWSTSPGPASKKRKQPRPGAVSLSIDGALRRAVFTHKPGDSEMESQYHRGVGRMSGLDFQVEVLIETLAIRAIGSPDGIQLLEEDESESEFGEIDETWLNI